MQARVQDFLKGGGGGEDIHKHPPPLDIVRVTSSALRKIEKHPHSWTFTSTPPPLDSARVTSSTFQGGGGGDRSRSRTLCIGFQYRDKFKGGDHPCHPPPPLDPPLLYTAPLFFCLSVYENSHGPGPYTPLEEFWPRTPPPPFKEFLDPPLYRVWLGCLYHGRNKESSSNRRGWLISHSGAYFHL